MNCSICKGDIRAGGALYWYENEKGKTKVAHFDCFYPLTREEKTAKPVKFKRG